MPQYGRQRTNPYYPGGGQEVSPEILGGMAYNPYSERTDIGFALRNALNNLLATRQAQGAQTREEEERQKKELQTAFENQIKEREIAVKEKEKPQNMPDWLSQIDFLVKTEGLTPAEAYNKVQKIKPEKTVADIKADARAKAEGTREGNPPAPKEDTEKTIERQFNLNAIKDYTNRIRGKIDAIKNANYGNYDPKDPRLETLNTLSRFLHRRGFQERIVKGKMTDDDKHGLDLVGQFLEAESPSVDLTDLLSPGKEVQPGPGTLTPPPQTSAPALPPEVQSYMQNHPGADLATVLQKYQEYIKKQGKK